MVQDRSHVTELYVDISMVSEKDKLDMKAFQAARVDIDKVVFVTNNQGEYLCGHQVEKMSKSKFNVVNPDDVVEQYGTDCFRLYEMFLGPLDQAKPWDTQNIGGVSKFLRKFYHLYWSEEGELLLNEDEPSGEEFKTLHQCIRKVHEDIERMGFNTCISAMMIAVNELKKLNCNKRRILEPLVLLIAPFAPHLAEELWQGALGHSDSVVLQTYPDWEEKYLVEDDINYPLCVNGKKRAEASFSKELSREELIENAIAHEDLQKWLEGKSVVKTIVVPDKMINVVVK
jgi:leucyl-tRNA synthetase